MGNPYLGRGKGAKKAMEPVRLYKSVNLKRDPLTKEIRLLSVAFSDDSLGFSVNEKAQCLLVGERGLNKGVIQAVHGDSPARACRCGFHAYREHSKAHGHQQMNPSGVRGAFVAGVVASGKMFEYNEGYRYGHQRVEEILATRCADSQFCTNHADRCIVNPKNMVIPVCSSHAYHYGTKNTTLSFKELGDRASAILPEGAPRIQVRSTYDFVKPWQSAEEKAEARAAKKQVPYVPRTKNNVGLDIFWQVLVTLLFAGIAGSAFIMFFTYFFDLILTK